jgi:dynein heavy chain
MQLATDLMDNLSSAKSSPTLFNSRERLFDLRPSTKHAKDLAQLIKNFEPYVQLWTTIHQFQRDSVLWMHGPFAELDGERIETDFNHWYKLIQKLQRTFKALPAPNSALTDLRKKVIE